MIGKTCTLAALALVAAGFGATPAIRSGAENPKCGDGSARRSSMRSSNGFAKAQDDFYELLDKAKDGKASAEMMQKRPGAEFIAELKTLALECKGDDAAKCWMSVADIASQANRTADLDAAIREAHVGVRRFRGDPGLAGVDRAE